MLARSQPISQWIERAPRRKAHRLLNQHLYRCRARLRGEQPLSSQ
jgi:hypothetical protein